MQRKNLAQILREAKINVNQEYARLFDLFYKRKFESFGPISNFCERCFLQFPFRGTCLSVEEFEEACYGGYFAESPRNFNLDYLIRFCEFTWNLVSGANKCPERLYEKEKAISETYLEQVLRIIDMVGYQTVYSEREKVYIFVPKSQEALAVAEISDKNLSYSVLEYNHHSLKGDLARKKSILRNMADDLEPHRNRLNSINKAFSGNLFQLFNKFIRHNNSENRYIRNMSDGELENCYDDIYQMWLLAKLELDNVERKPRVEDLLKKVNVSGG